VLDGRDIGTVICPDATVKLFVTASPEVRAKRRFAELAAAGSTQSYQDVLEDVRERDARDKERAVSPLAAAPDAVVIDTSAMDIDAAIGAAISAICERRS
jgi:cytidylate kinase